MSNFTIIPKIFLSALGKRFFLLDYSSLVLALPFFVIFFTSKIKQCIFHIVFPATHYSIIIFYGTEGYLDDICAY